MRVEVHRTRSNVLLLSVYYQVNGWLSLLTCGHRLHGFGLNWCPPNHKLNRRDQSILRCSSMGAKRGRSSSPVVRWRINLIFDNAISTIWWQLYQASQQGNSHSVSPVPLPSAATMTLPTPGSKPRRARGSGQRLGRPFSRQRQNWLLRPSRRRSTRGRSGPLRQQQYHYSPQRVQRPSHSAYHHLPTPHREILLHV